MRLGSRSLCRRAQARARRGLEIKRIENTTNRQVLVSIYSKQLGWVSQRRRWLPDAADGLLLFLLSTAREMLLMASCYFSSPWRGAASDGFLVLLVYTVRELLLMAFSSPWRGSCAGDDPGRSWAANYMDLLKLHSLPSSEIYQAIEHCQIDQLQIHIYTLDLMLWISSQVYNIFHDLFFLMPVNLQ